MQQILNDRELLWQQWGEVEKQFLSVQLTITKINHSFQRSKCGVANPKHFQQTFYAYNGNNCDGDISGRIELMQKY